MGLVKTGVSAIGRLLIAAVLAAAFLFGMTGVVWLSLRGEEIKVPEVVGKDFLDSERELAALGLKIKRRSYRYSQEKPNTVIEQAPRAGDTVKTGQTVLVVVAQANPEGTEAPAPVKKADEDNTSEDSPEKPKKSNSNSTKKPEKTRDVISNKTNKNANAANSNANTANSNKSGTPNNSDSKNGNVIITVPPPTRPTPGKTPTPAKTPKTPNDRPAATSGDMRNRRVPQ